MLYCYFFLKWIETAASLITTTFASNPANSPYLFNVSTLETMEKIDTASPATIGFKLVIPKADLMTNYQVGLGYNHM